MNKLEDIDPVEYREAIRQRAFELAESGLFDDWETIKRTLWPRFDLVHLQHIFASPFCRLDLDQRCQTARTSGLRSWTDPAGNGEKEEPNAFPPDSHALASARSKPRRERQRGAGAAARNSASCLTENIAVLLADGCERTATQIAQQLSAGPREVRRALRAMLANGEVRVAGQTPRSSGGRPALMYVGGPQAEGRGGAAARAHSFWSSADPVVLEVMDALARSR